MCSEETERGRNQRSIITFDVAGDGSGRTACQKELEQNEFQYTTANIVDYTGLLNRTITQPSHQ
jgi:hypothetical protein